MEERTPLTPDEIERQFETIRFELEPVVKTAKDMYLEKLHKIANSRRAKARGSVEPTVSGRILESEEGVYETYLSDPFYNLAERRTGDATAVRWRYVSYFNPNETEMYLLTNPSRLSQAQLSWLPGLAESVQDIPEDYQEIAHLFEFDSDGEWYAISLDDESEEDILEQVHTAFLPDRWNRSSLDEKRVDIMHQISKLGFLRKYFS